MIVKRLQQEQWSKLKTIFNQEFDSDLPLPQNSEIFIVADGGKMIGFLLAEQVTVLGQIYVIPERRNESRSIVKSLLDYCKEKIAKHNVVGAVASETRFENLYKGFGMQEISGKFFRKNLD